MKIRVLILILLVNFLAGCMNGTPSENDGQKAANRHLHGPLLGGVYRNSSVIEFKKTNGVKNGNEYKMYFNAIVESPNSNGTVDRNPIHGYCFFELSENGWRDTGCHF